LALQAIISDRVDYSMTFLRKLEVFSGVTTCLIGLALAGYLLRTDFETARRLDLDYSEIFAGFIGAMLFFIIPGVLIGAGSYVHASRRRSHGRVMVIIGSLFLTIAFTAIFFQTGNESVGVIQARFVLTIAAIATLIISFIVGDRN
jgi:drug/metabolite transporter (DMT)-like permease